MTDITTPILFKQELNKELSLLLKKVLQFVLVDNMFMTREYGSVLHTDINNFLIKYSIDKEYDIYTEEYIRDIFTLYNKFYYDIYNSDLDNHYRTIANILNYIRRSYILNNSSNNSRQILFWCNLLQLRLDTLKYGPPNEIIYNDLANNKKYLKYKIKYFNLKNSF